MNITVIGVPFNGDGTTPEIENPAQAFRDEGLISLLKAILLNCGCSRRGGE